MTLDLPRPNSFWRHRRSALIYVVVVCQSGEVVAVNMLGTWAGDAVLFTREFEEVSCG